MDSTLDFEYSNRGEKRFQKGSDKNNNILMDSLTLVNSSKTLENVDSRSRLKTSPDRTHKNSEFILTEHRSRIQKIKNLMSKKPRKVTEEEVLSNHGKEILFLNQSQSTNSLWEYSYFTTQLYKMNEEVPIVQSNNFSKVDMITLVKNSLGIRNLIFRSELEIDYGIVNAEMNINFSLKGESTFWLFLHCDRTLNEETCAVIQIKKEEKKNAFITLGVFLEDGEFKTFSKDQLVNFTKKSEKNKKYQEEDIIFINLVVLDPGDEAMKLKIYVNNSLVENNIFGNNFLPVNNSKRILFAGNGEEINLTKFECICSAKPKYMKEFNITAKKEEGMHCEGGCGDCLIY
ncbi:MAG: hypothetical protein MJ252_25615 [archaeon]|nr:hypothetical protein [archaeon]